MIKLYKISAFVLFATLCLSGCGVFWAGGVSEEENTVVAFQAVDDSLNVVDSVVVVDTCTAQDSPCANVNQKGSFVIDGQNGGTDSLVKADSSHFYIVRSSSSELSLNSSSSTALVVGPTVTLSREFSGYIWNVDSPLNLSLDVNGNIMTTRTDEGGAFKFENVPQGTYVLYASDEDGSSPDVAFFLTNGKCGSLLGPVPASVVSEITVSDLLPPQEHQDTLVGSENPDKDSTVFGGGFGGDGLGQSDSVIFNDGPVVPVVGQMPNAIEDGLVCSLDAVALSQDQESECRFSSNPEAVVVEVNVELTSVDENASYRKNILGKFWEGYNGFFSLAVIDNDCGVTEPSFAFFVSDGSGFSCQNAVISTAKVETGVPMSLTAVWLNDSVSIYKNGFSIGFQVIGDIQKNVVDAPLVFGDNGKTVKLNDVRLGEKAITSADVLYRYYQKGGAQ